MIPAETQERDRGRWKAAGTFSYSPDAGGEKHSLKAFLRAPIGTLHDEQITVRRVIKYFANVYGGVHHGTPSDHVEEFFQQALVPVDPMRAMMFSWLDRIAHSTADALEPIANAVTGNPITWTTRYGDRLPTYHSLFDVPRRS